MRIFKLKLVFFNEYYESLPKDFYYSILGAILNFFENEQFIYESIAKLSFKTYKNQLLVFLSIFGENNFKWIVNKLLDKKGNVILLDSYKFKFSQIDINFDIFDLNSLKAKNVSKFELKFLSPTQVRNQNKVINLPYSEKFLLSTYNKLVLLYQKELISDKAGFEKWLKSNILANKFNLKTELVKIKKSKRAGVVGNISYIVYERNEEFEKLLFLILKAIPFVGIGSGTKLGLGNVEVKILS